MYSIGIYIVKLDIKSFLVLIKLYVQVCAYIE